MDDTKTRIKKLLEHYHLSAGDFAKKIGVQKSSISHLLSGRNKPSFAFMNKLSLNFPEVNLRWLITGEGNMLTSGYRTNQTEASYSIDKEKTDKKKISDKVFQKGEMIEKTSFPEDKISEKEINSIVMIYENDTFKILKKSKD